MPDVSRDAVARGGSAAGAAVWQCRKHRFDLTARPLVMGILNVTPDSFSDGGRFLDPRAAIDHALRLRDEGADLVDVGAESTRPGSARVPDDIQIERMMPVLEALARDGVVVSVDTSSAAVARLALEAGAAVVNDVTAMRDSGMAGVVAKAGAGIVLMHMRGEPATMQQDPSFTDVAAEVTRELGERVAAAVAAGIPEQAIAVDPGIGFGKHARHNLELIARIPELVTLGRPVVLGVSRKSFIGAALDLPVTERLEGSLAAAAVGAFLGASVIRAHDVRATVRAVTIAKTIAEARRK